MTEVYLEVHGDRTRTWPTRQDVSNAEIIAEAGGLLWQRALRNADDHLLVGSARVLHCVWMMVRSQDERARAAMLELEKACMKYEGARFDDHAAHGERDGRRRRDADRWSTRALPPRAKVDRARNMTALVQIVELLRGARFDGFEMSREDLAVDWTISAIERLFPQVPSPRKGRRERLAVHRKVVAAWRRKAERKNGTIESLDPEQLAVETLVALSVPRERAWEWLRGTRA